VIALNEMDKVLLINMPFCSLDSPAIGISLLKSILIQKGIPCEIRYLNFTFAEFLGYDDYIWFTKNLPHRMLAGEWLFSQYIFGQRALSINQYIEEILQGEWGLDDPSIQRILRIKEVIGPFLGHCLNTIDWSEYFIIGFTSAFQQNLASIALAYLVKKSYPEKIIVFGGPNCEAEMGIELHRLFPFIDFICSGEADYSFPELVKCLLDRRPIKRIEGIVFRHNDQTIFSGPPICIEDLDTLPYPDYDDYFEVYQKSPLGGKVEPWWLFESSRGCWWGEKHQCKWCGLNAGSINYRSKSKDRVIEELRFFVSRYNAYCIAAVDNILNMKYFKDLLPELKKTNIEIQLSYETKANLNKEQVRLLKEAGVSWIQAGIESLSTRVLRLMNKGVTALQNVQLLKWCKEFGLNINWNYMYRLPKERAEDYKEVESLIGSIMHLQPPKDYGPVMLDRFSPYFSYPEEYGITNIRPKRAYYYVYPVDEESIFNIAYHFDFDYKEDQGWGYIRPLIEAISRWKNEIEDHGGLYWREDQEGKLIIEDTRPISIQPKTILEGAEKTVYKYCDKVRNLSSILHYLQRCYPEYFINEENLKNFLEYLVNLKIMLEDNGHYLSLAIPLKP
jgi:ribosomal peptide maturation radical SAM protein 1